jgi:excisionase family DNA binding protein
MKLLTPAQVAKICGVSRMTVYRWMRSGKLPYQTLGKHYPKLIYEKDIPTFLRRKLPLDKKV